MVASEVRTQMREYMYDCADCSYFYGLPWSKHIVVYDTLMDSSSPAEVEAVLGG